MKDNQTLAFEMKDGDETALKTFMAKNRGWVRQKAYLMLKNEQDAEEATLDVFSKIWQKVHMWRETREFNSWFGVFVNNTIVDAYRARETLENKAPWFFFDGDPDIASIPAIDPHSPEPVDIIIRAEDADRILDALAVALEGIRPHHRLAWRLRVIEQYSIPEVVRIIGNGKSEGTVKVWIHRCKEKLQERMAHLLKDDGYEG